MITRKEQQLNKIYSIKFNDEYIIIVNSQQIILKFHYVWINISKFPCFELSQIVIGSSYFSYIYYGVIHPWLEILQI